MEWVDPPTADAHIRDAAAALRSWRRKLRTAPAHAREQDPLASRRLISTRQAFQRAAELPDGLPGKRDLVRWVAFLTIERATHEDLCSAEASRVDPVHPVDQLDRRIWSIRELIAQAVFAREPARRATAAATLARVGDDASSNALRWLGRRHEAARQLGLRSLSELEAPFTQDVEPAQAARTLLEQTESLAAEVMGDRDLWQEALHWGAATDAHDGWPSKLTPRWLREVFDAKAWTQGLALDFGPMPTARSGASFARAFARYGATLHRAASAQPGTPFVMAERPYDAGAASYGALFASLLCAPPFLRRKLGLGAVSISRQVPRMVRALVTGCRREAAKAVMACTGNPEAARQAHALMVTRAFRAPVPVELAGVVPRYDPRSTALVAGILQGAVLREQLVEQFDEDWFDNPRCQEFLRAVDVTHPVVLDARVVERGAQAWRRFLEGGFDQAT
jgi:hypothetical protein